MTATETATTEAPAGDPKPAAFDAACAAAVAEKKPAATYDDVDTAFGPTNDDKVMPSSVMRLLTGEQADLVALADADPAVVLSRVGEVTTILVPGGMSDGVSDLRLPYAGLNRRDAAEKAIDTARAHNKAVTLRHAGQEVMVQPGWTIDEVADQLLHPVAGRRRPAGELEDDVNDSFTGPNGG